MVYLSDMFGISHARMDEICSIIAEIPITHGFETYINIARGSFNSLSPIERDLAFMLLGATVEGNMEFSDTHGDD